MSILVIIESVLILVALVAVWRRVRPADPPFGAPMGWAALALLGQGLFLLLADVVVDWLRTDTSTSRVTTAVWAVWGIQFFRAAFFVVAVAMWLRIVKPRLQRSWRGIILAIALLIITLLPEVPVVGSLLVIIVLFRLKWTNQVYGWKRFVGFFAALVLFFLTLVNVDADVQGTRITGDSASFSDKPSIVLLSGDFPEPAATVSRLALPWNTVVRAAGVLLRWQLLIACLQFLVFPIRLRGLSLKRRFTVTMILYRVIPGLLGFAAVVLGVYFGLGLHKARLAQEAFSETLNANLRAAGVILEATSGWPASRDDDAVIRQFEEAKRWMTDGGANAHFVLKQVSLSYQDPDSAGTWQVGVDSVLKSVSTPGTPVRFLASDLYGAGATDSVTGLTVADTVLYFASAAAVGGKQESVVAEVYVPVDAAYLARIAQLIQVDVRFRASPDMFIGETSFTVSSDTAWTDSPFEVTASAWQEPLLHGFWHGNHFLARAFIPLSNWREQLTEDISGAADLRLDVSPDRLVRGIFSNMLVFSSNAVAVVIFASILLLFLIAEYSAARTGRGIIRGILDDVKGLAQAAERFGTGDLSHRIAVHGKDEFGSLSGSFNTMAENIEQNQELLLEKERLEADLTLARDIQQRMLPQSPPVMPGLDVAGLSIPSREVGGDLFYFLPVPEGRLGLTIGDVSGKSVPAALLMSNVLAALKTEARLVEHEDEILSHLNRLIVEQVEPGQFVTFFYGVVDRQTRKLSYACAGHNPPLKVDKDGNVQWLSEAGVPLGVLPDNTYTPAEVLFEEGDVLVLYSDGVTEAEKRPAIALQRTAPELDGEAVADAAEDTAVEEPDFFDDHRLADTVRAARGQSASEIIRSLVDAVREFTGGADLSDDLTIVVVKIVGR
jgi:serine phosphatase RsbU (regulator of sigma subunit)